MRGEMGEGSGPLIFQNVVAPVMPNVTVICFYVVVGSAASVLTTCALMLMSSMTLTVFIAGRFLGGEI